MPIAGGLFSATSLRAASTDSYGAGLSPHGASYGSGADRGGFLAGAQYDSMLIAYMAAPSWVYLVSIL